jgi:hypothetical protein
MLKNIDLKCYGRVYKKKLLINIKNILGSWGSMRGSPLMNKFKSKPRESNFGGSGGAGGSCPRLEKKGFIVH